MLGSTANIQQARELIELLGYRKVSDGIKLPDRVASYFWYDEVDYRSYAGVELDIFRPKKSPIVVSTRSRASRSYWDLLHQNHTLKLLRDLLGGTFETDAGRNRYWRPNGPPPKPVSSGCFLARWRFSNALIAPRIYLEQRGLEEAHPQKTGLRSIDRLNPKLFSNNLVLSYLVAIWEDFFKSSFTALLRFSTTRDAALKRAKISQDSIASIAAGVTTVEEAIAQGLSFQRPSLIGTNFKLIDPNLDLARCLRKPYRRRKHTLFDSIDMRIDQRNELVHTGNIDCEFSDELLEKTLVDFETAVDRCYREFGLAFKFTPMSTR